MSAIWPMSARRRRRLRTVRRLVFLRSLAIVFTLAAQARRRRPSRRHSTNKGKIGARTFARAFFFLFGSLNGASARSPLVLSRRGAESAAESIRRFGDYFRLR